MMGLAEGGGVEDESEMEDFLQSVLNQFISKDVLNAPMQVSYLICSDSAPFDTCHKRIAIYPLCQSQRRALRPDPGVSVRFCTVVSHTPKTMSYFESCLMKEFDARVWTKSPTLGLTKRVFCKRRNSCRNIQLGS